MSANSTSIDHLTNLVSSRNKSLGLNLSGRQGNINVPNGLKSEYIIIPSTSAPQYGLI